jgi:hypothetical protein
MAVANLDRVEGLILGGDAAGGATGKPRLRRSFALPAPRLQSNTPILQYSNTPILQYSNTPMRRTRFGQQRAWKKPGTDPVMNTV